MDIQNAPDDIATFHPDCGSHCMPEMVTSEPQQTTHDQWSKLFLHPPADISTVIRKGFYTSIIISESLGISSNTVIVCS